ncbi:MAG: DUF2079 domain-containing protein [Candidatus Eremiobacteraeota bacterium]|nr:DUF2079 domain-containing protein [Candidatus Eremiobacteraeota bacterium]
MLATALCTITYWRYAIFRNGVDLGIFSQVIAGLPHGFSSTAEGGTNHLLVHWSPIIAIGWPFVRIFGPLGLQYLQAIAVAAVVFPIWALARTRFTTAPAFALVVVAAIYPTLCANGVGDFHEMAFVPLLSATLVYALDRRRWSMGVCAALLLLCTKEDQFVVLAVNGALFAVTARDGTAKRIGLLVCGMAVAMAVLYFALVRPAIDSHAAYESLRFFDWSAAHGEWRTSIGTVLLARLRYLAIMLVPLAFLPCLSRYGLFMIPGFVEIFAAHQPITMVPGAHYSALVTGYALAGFVDGASRLAALRPHFVKWLVAAGTAASIWITIFASPMEYWYFLYRFPNAHDVLLERTLARLPRQADVGAQDEIFAHLALDPKASIGFGGQRWFVYDRTHYSPRSHAVDEPAVRRAVDDGRYTVISDRDDIVVLQRTTPAR